MSHLSACVFLPPVFPSFLPCLPTLHMYPKLFPLVGPAVRMSDTAGHSQSPAYAEHSPEMMGGGEKEELCCPVTFLHVRAAVYSMYCEWRSFGYRSVFSVDLQHIPSQKRCICAFVERMGGCPDFIRSFPYFHAEPINV